MSISSFTWTYYGFKLPWRIVVVTGQRSPGRPCWWRGRELLPPDPGPDSEGAILHGPPPWTGEAWGEISPVPGSAVAADEHRPTGSTDLVSVFFLPYDVAREETLDHPVLSYCNFYLNTLREVVTLTFDLLTLESCHVMLLGCSIPVPSCNRIWLTVPELGRLQLSIDR